MLTSSLIVPNALNLKLPGQSSATSTVSERPNEIRIAASGAYTYNSSPVNSSGLHTSLRNLRQQKGLNTPVMVTADPNSPNQYVVTALDIIRKNGLNAILNESAN